MAEVLRAFPLGHKPRPRANGIYDKYLDGQIWKLDPGDHTCASARSLQAGLMERAKRLGVMAVTRTEGDCVYVQAIRAAQEG